MFYLFLLDQKVHHPFSDEVLELGLDNNDQLMVFVLIFNLLQDIKIHNEN
jgi:hypothetical protein